VGIFFEPIFKRLNSFILTFNSDTGLDLTARTQMYLGSFNVAFDYFPFGSSLGTFGGSVAASLYSPLYDHYGISSIRGFEPYNEQIEGYNFLSDFKWPHIIAEFGFIFMFLYFLLYFFPFFNLTFKKYFDKSSPYYFLTICFSILLFIEGLGSSIPENLAFYSISFLFIYSPYFILKSRS